MLPSRSRKWDSIECPYYVLLRWEKKNMAEFTSRASVVALLFSASKLPLHLPVNVYIFGWSVDASEDIRFFPHKRVAKWRRGTRNLFLYSDFFSRKTKYNLHGKCRGNYLNGFWHLSVVITATYCTYVRLSSKCNNNMQNAIWLHFSSARHWQKVRAICN